MRGQGNATLWHKAQPIKSQESGDPVEVGFWISSCAKLDSVQKFLDWHLEYFFSWAQMLVATTFELWKLF